MYEIAREGGGGGGGQGQHLGQSTRARGEIETYAAVNAVGEVDCARWGPWSALYRAAGWHRQGDAQNSSTQFSPGKAVLPSWMRSKQCSMWCLAGAHSFVSPHAATVEVLSQHPRLRSGMHGCAMPGDEQIVTNPRGFRVHSANRSSNKSAKGTKERCGARQER